jgi:hypothetical protein
MMNAKVACDPTQIHAIHIQLHGLLTHFLRIAMLFRLGSGLAATMHTADALGTTFGLSGFVLARCLVTSRTRVHNPILAQIYIHSLQV